MAARPRRNGSRPIASDREIIKKNEFAYAIEDKYAVTEFHTLIIPKRDVSNYFDLD